jgi:hypothetical protein
MNDLPDQFENDYRQKKHDEAEELHNAIVAVLSERRADIQTMMYVLDMIRFELLMDKFRQLFPDEPKPGEIRFGKPE